METRQFKEILPDLPGGSILGVSKKAYLTKLQRKHFIKLSETPHS